MAHTNALTYSFFNFALLFAHKFNRVLNNHHLILSMQENITNAIMFSILVIQTDLKMQSILHLQMTGMYVFWCHIYFYIKQVRGTIFQCLYQIQIWWRSAESYCIDCCYTYQRIETEWRASGIYSFIDIVFYQ